MPKSVGHCCKCAWWKEIRVSSFVPSRCRDIYLNPMGKKFTKKL